MTEYELASLFNEAFATMRSSLETSIAALFAMLVTAYFAASKLTRSLLGRVRPFVSASLIMLLASGGAALAQTDDVGNDAQIRAHVAQMSDDFLNFRIVKAFPHDMSLAEAYRWQDEMVEILRPTLGEVVGYKTGGHNPGPVNPAFPPGGIRAYLLAGMFREDGAAIRVEDTTDAGFLEADFALRVGDTSINDAETDLEILAGLDAVVPFAEVPDPYYEPDANATNRGVIANMGSRLAFMGEPIPIEPTDEWLRRISSFDFAVLDENGVIIQSGTMADWYQPIAVVRWLRDQLKESGKELVPGQILSLGNIGIIRAIHEGTPRGPAYQSNQFRIEYYGLRDDGPATVTLNIAR